MRGPARAPPPWHAPDSATPVSGSPSPRGAYPPRDNFGGACTRSSAPSPCPLCCSRASEAEASAFLSTLACTFTSPQRPRACSPPPTAIIESKIMDYGGKVEFEEIGKVLAIGDGIGVHGLQRVQAGEMVEFDSGLRGMALNLENDNVGVVAFGTTADYEDTQAHWRHHDIPVGEGMLGRSPTDPATRSTGRALHRRDAAAYRGQGARHYRPPVGPPAYEPGLKAADSLVPVGRGQRELIIGDRQTGKTAVAIDTIINQKGVNALGDKSKSLYCIYAAVGQKRRLSLS